MYVRVVDDERFSEDQQAVVTKDGRTSEETRFHSRARSITQLRFSSGPTPV
jgi:hypothetical protein